MAADSQIVTLYAGAAVAGAGQASWKPVVDVILTGVMFSHSGSCVSTDPNDDGTDLSQTIDGVQERFYLHQLSLGGYPLSNLYFPVSAGMEIFFACQNPSSATLIFHEVGN